MRVSLLHILLILSIMTAHAFAADAPSPPPDTAVNERVQPTAAPTATSTASPVEPSVEVPVAPPVAVPETATGSFREETGGIVRVNEGKVYVDHGSAHGVTVGLEMEVFRLEPIESLDGKVLDVEETHAGKIKVIEVRKQLSVAEVVECATELQRGFRVKFLLPVAPGTAATGTAATEGERTNCPEGMIYFSAGGFTYYPSSEVKDNPGPMTEQNETTEGFCIDAAPAPHPQKIWLEALDACTARQMRLCEKVELRKTCVFSKEAVRPAEGPDGKELKLKDFIGVREWGFEWKDSEDGASMEAGSCSCGGTRPACYGCYYPNCGTSKRQYRCCGDPM